MRFALLFLVMTFSMPLAHGQEAKKPVPDENVLARLVWSSMVALDNANRTNNYEVFHAIGSPGFRENYSVDDLRTTFAGLREGRVDIGRAVMTTPTYYLAPGFDENGFLRLRGAFEFRPNAIRFDILYRQVGGGWRIEAISVAEMPFDAPR